MKQHLTTTRRHKLDPKALQPLLHEVLPVGEGALPTAVVGWTRKGMWTRLQADYPNGTGLTVHFDHNGKVSSAKASFDIGVFAVQRKAERPQGSTLSDSDGDDGA